MNPNIKGWLHGFCLKLESDYWKSIERPLDTGYEPALYRTIQPSGLMYGHPVKELGAITYGPDKLDAVARMKLIYAESLLTTGSLKLKSDNLITEEASTEHLVTELSDYFLNMYPGLYQGSTSSYLKNPYQLTEKLISQRVSVKTSLMKNYLASLFHNSLLFLDVYYFGEWVSSFGEIPASDIINEQSRLRLTILGVMALAANADNKLQKEEKALFEFYLESAGLDAAMSREARALLNNFGRLSEVDIPQIESWLIRKYLMEMAILVTLADREINPSEQEFIAELGEKLNFTQSEISDSMLAVESFVLANWPAMHYLLGKHNLEIISGRFVTRLKNYININKDYVVQEIQESRELFHLLGKSRTNTLTEVEKKIVNEQLIDILKTIPAFVIIALPFTFITLPTLLALLPKNAFPSSFRE
ncbi:MAG: hypothetical protein DHS20C17_33300 [Cyclobacteriaceae bacterium]|nr:MAG: hypothetical protein DHS20C17_33300 [Cyclobacteriaceae bacterium]